MGANTYLIELHVRKGGLHIALARVAARRNIQCLENGEPVEWVVLAVAETTHDAEIKKQKIAAWMKQRERPANDANQTNDPASSPQEGNDAGTKKEEEEDGD